MPYIEVIELRSFEEQADCLEEMFAPLSNVLEQSKFEEFKEAVYLREDTASTYIENGLAVPHGRVADFGDECIVVGVSRDGVDWPVEENKARFVALVGVDRSRVHAYMSILQRLIKWYKKHSSNLSGMDIKDVRREIMELLEK